MGCVFEVLLILSPDPSLSDCERFPARACIAPAVEFNRAYRSHLECRQGVEMHRWWYWEEVLTETDYLYHCWTALSAARGDEGQDEESRREGLRRLRVLVGEEAYFQGAMPPCVPVWRFWTMN